VSTAAFTPVTAYIQSTNDNHVTKTPQMPTDCAVSANGLI